MFQIFPTITISNLKFYEPQNPVTCVLLRGILILNAIPISFKEWTVFRKSSSEFERIT